MSTYSVISESGRDMWSEQPGGVGAGRLVIDRVPQLREHAGTPPDLLLEWNAMSAPSTVDTVVHLHGYSGKGAGMQIVRDKKPVSGLDFTDPDAPGATGRTRPTLSILPRGHHQPTSARGVNRARYTFPALVTPGRLDRLVDDALARFMRQTGVTVTRGRLVVTAHSGGGAPLMLILAHTDPDEIHTFDALYNDPKNLIVWVRRKLGSGSGALRVLYRKDEPTARHSEQVAAVVRAAGSRLFRVEPTTVAHNDIPRRYGWRLLADPGADLPGIGPAGGSGKAGGMSGSLDPAWVPQPGDGDYFGEAVADESGSGPEELQQ